MYERIYIPRLHPQPSPLFNSLTCVREVEPTGWHVTRVRKTFADLLCVAALGPCVNAKLNVKQHSATQCNVTLVDVCMQV